MQARLAVQADQVARYKPSPGQLLDVGCATGLFLDVMRERGWSCVGVEPSAEAARFAREQMGLDVRAGMLTTDLFPPASLDVVTLWHVLEHVPSPRQLLRLIRMVLKPDGALFITVPNIASWEARWFGPEWVHLDLPRHFYHFSPDTLSRMLAQADFRVLKIDHFALRTNTSFAGSLVKVMPTLSLRGRLQDLQPVVNALRDISLHLLTLPIVTLSALLAAGPVITVTAVPGSE